MKINKNSKSGTGSDIFFHPAVWLCCMAVTLVGPARAAAESISLRNPVRVEGPVQGGAHARAFTATVVDLKKYGYAEEEYFVAGQASSYQPKQEAPLSSNGLWEVTAGAAAPYKTRFLIRYPVDHKHFNGTVVVEWLQASAGFDKDVSWLWNHEEIMRRGYVWVGVSAQSQGVDGPAYEALPKGPSAPFKNLREWDPERYGSLHIGDEDLSYAIFSQVGALIGVDRRVRSLRNLPVRRRIALGNTYAGYRLVTYYNAIQPRDKVFDAFLIGSRSGSHSSPLSKSTTMPAIVQLRSDIATPVIVLNTDAEAIPHYPARQQPSSYYRLWEVAGSAHTNVQWTALMYRHMQRDFDLPVPVCSVEPNDLPQQYVAHAALWQLQRWLASGAAAADFPPAAVLPSLQFDKDANGNTAGGIRLPQLAVPRARYEAGGNPPCPGSPGHKADFTNAYLERLYPDAASYTDRFSRAAEGAYAAGFLLKEDLDAMLRER